MKYLALLTLAASLSACVTTDTTLPDGTKIHTSRQDAKVVKAVVGAVTEAATRAAIQALQDQAAKQNQ